MYLTYAACASLTSAARAAPGVAVFARFFELGDSLGLAVVGACVAGEGDVEDGGVVVFEAGGGLPEASFCWQAASPDNSARVRTTVPAEATMRVPGRARLNRDPVWFNADS